MYTLSKDRRNKNVGKLVTLFYDHLIFKQKAGQAWEAAKKGYFLSGPATKAFFPSIKKNLFSLVAHLFSTHPLLVARPLRKEIFLRLPLAVFETVIEFAFLSLTLQRYLP